MGQSFGDYLKKLREDRNLTLRDVEREAKVSNAYLSQLERGDREVPNYKVLSRLAELYGISVTKLMEVAEGEAKGEKVETSVESPNIEFLSRGYEKLSPEKKKQFKNFLQYLVEQEKKKK